MKKSSTKKNRILVAPLNWGLGHATRCIPIIKALITHGFEPLIASDGEALNLLKLEFPQLQSFELPSYNITYPKRGNSLKLKLLKDSPRLIKTLKQEQQVIKDLVKLHNIDGIISDNRFGVRHIDIPSVFITHQLKVLSGHTTWLSTKVHQNIISKFNECWVPDLKGNKNISGDLGQIKDTKLKIKYIGPLSRFDKEQLDKAYDVLVILSGPEPQRTYLEEKLLTELQSYKGTICFVKGIVEPKQQMTKNGHITIYNYMTTEELQHALNASDLVISRSGYSSIMDYTRLEKRALLIPTPSQFEQEYLADKFTNEGIAPSCTQQDFSIEMLKTIDAYQGFKKMNFELNFKELFSLFEGK